MTAKKSPNKKAKPRKGSGNVGSGKRIRSLATGVLTDPRVRAWDQLLRDPCAANLAPPCYAGIDSGYLVRTVDIVSPPSVTGVAMTVGSTQKLDLNIQYTPFNVSLTTGMLANGNVSGVAVSAASQVGVTNFVTNGGAVKRYRPIAACVKYITNAPVTVRQGVIGVGYSPGMIYKVNDTPTAAQILSECQHTVPNGMSIPEVRWLPTAVDENFTDVLVGNNTAAGSVYFALKDVDGTAVSGTAATANGYFELTTVWEWVPNVTTGACVAPKAPLPYTSQAVLATIGDMGAYLFHGVRAVGAGVVRGMVQEGVRYASGRVTGGYRAHPMLMN